MMKRRLALLLAVMIGLLGLAGCRQVHVRPEESRPEELQQAENESDELLVFYQKGLGKMVLNNFKSEYPEVVFQEVSFEKQDQIKKKIEKYGYPNLILFDNTERLDSWVKEDLLEDMTNLMDTDEDFNEAAYFPGAKRACTIRNALYALPLGLEAHYLTIREEAWQGSAFEYLPEQYSIQELLEAIEIELDRGRKDFYYVLNGRFGMDYFGEWMLDSGGLQIEDGQVQMDQELLALTARVADKWQSNSNDAMKASAIQYSKYPKIDPRFGEGQYAAVSWNDLSTIAPQIGLVYAQSVNDALLGQDTHVLFRPLNGSPGRYTAKISVLGAIGRHSSKQEESYEVLRKMMDLPPMACSDVGATNIFEEEPFPVNREQAFAMLQKVEEEGVPEFFLQVEATGVLEGDFVPKQPLKDELKAELEKYLNGIEYVYLSDSYLDRWWIFAEPTGQDYNSLYEPTVEAIEKYLETGIIEYQ